MLLCCFREPKETKKKKNTGYDTSEDDGSPAHYARTNSQVRPLKTTLPATPLSFSSGNNEILVASVTLHDQQPLTASTAHQIRQQRQHSLCSYTSDRSRPPSRDGSDRQQRLERAPMPKEAKRLLKQRSQESFKDNNKSVTSIPYIDASPPSATALASATSANGLERGKTASSAASSSTVSPNSHKGAGAASTPNLPTSTPVHGPIYATATSNRRPSANNGVGASSSSKINSEASLSSASNLLNGSSNQLSTVEERIQGRGMSRSSASYGIQQLLQDQICREEKESQAKLIEREVKAAVARVTASYEERLSSARAEHNLKIQQVLRDKTTAVNNARNTFETELKRQLATFEKDLHELKCKHNSDIQNRDHMAINQLRKRDQEHQQIIAEYEARDQAWQAEKEEVLAEIQRLKEEANRFISILSAEDDPERVNEMLSPSKRQSLTREVESLQLVVEMRTAELHKLREERTRHLQQLEELERTKTLLEKANARVEDLTVQLATKTELERQLSWEKSQLENFFETETKNKTRISMQVEELQWRIKHNKELPPPQVFSPATTTSMSSTASSNTGNENSPPSQKQGSFVTSSPNNNNINNNNNGLVPSIMPVPVASHQSSWVQAPTIVMNNGTKVDDVNKNEEISGRPRPKNIDGIEPRNLDVPKGPRSNRSTASEDSLEESVVEVNNHLKDYNENGHEGREKADESKDSDIDAGLSDEGLGDITSEASNSPQPPMASTNTASTTTSNGQSKTSNNNQDVQNQQPDFRRKKRSTEIENRCDNFVQEMAKNSLKTPEKANLSTSNNNHSLPTSPCDERVPSRIPFPKKQHKSQTNL